MNDRPRSRRLAGTRPRTAATRRCEYSCDSAAPQINTFLTFNNQAEDAARFYTSIFPNSKITRITRYPDLGPQSPFKTGGVMTVEFTLDGRALAK